MRNLLTILLITLTVLTASAAGWERMESMPYATEPIETEQAGVAGNEQCIYLTLQRKTEVTVFNILGQTVVRQQLSPGTYRLQVKSRGIYIVRIGAATRRIVL